LLIDATKTIKNLSYGSPYHYSEITIHYLEREDFQYLSVNNIFIEGKSVRTSVVHLLKISQVDTQMLMSNYNTKNNSF